MTFLETERLYLRNVMPNDVDVMFDYRNNEICSRYQRGQTKTYEGIEDVSYKHLRRKYLDKLIAMGAVVMTIPESPTSSKRKYILSELGQKLINK